MGIRKIRTDEDPILRRVSRPVTQFDDRLFQLLDDLHDTLVKANGLGLAAVQIGVLRRAVVVNFDGRWIELINPEIKEQSEETQKESEGCLSLPHRAGVTVRPKTVVVRAQNREGNWCLYKGSDLEARCFCHEIDHLDGKLYSDRLAPGESIYPVED